MNIYYSNGKTWYTLKACAFASEVEIAEISEEVIDILSDYYNGDNIKVISHFI